MSFVQRQIGVTFTLGTGQFQGGGNQANYTDLRVSARIEGPGGPLGTAQVAIWGMSLSDMNQLSLIGKLYPQISGQNRITITAGDAGGTLATVFEGIILASFPDLSAQPQACFHVAAQGCAAINVANSAPTSFPGPVNVATSMQQLATKAGLKFQNYGVSATLASQQYLEGSIGQQISKLAYVAKIEYLIDQGTLYIGMPGSGYGDAISIAEGVNMIGYPAFNQNQVLVGTLFNASLKTMTKINIQSSMTAAAGDWIVNKVTHEIESQMPKGKWFTRVSAYATGSTVATN